MDSFRRSRGSYPGRPVDAGIARLKPNVRKSSISTFNPNAGLTYALAPGLQVYGSYAEANRAPIDLLPANWTIFG
jgi:outer membrane receptor protein involved in Fe transport